MSKAEVIDNLPFDEYLKLPRLSSSALKDFMQAPSYYKYRKSAPMKETDAMKLGTMVHTWMLENHKFHKEYMSMPKIDKRTKAGKELFAEYTENANGRVLMDEDVIKKFTTLPVYNDTRNEVTILFEVEGIKCKARFDCLRPNHVIEDVKTIADIFKIDRQFASLKYYIQAGFYAQAYHEAFEVWPKQFLFTFISTGDYFEKVTREISFEYLEHGRLEAIKNVKRFRQCVEDDYWPGLPSSEIEMPMWM